jgi:peptidyl-prolyl cis-trans isomerase C
MMVNKNEITSGESGSPPERPYNLLRAALELFGKAPSELDPRQLEKAKRHSEREHDIEDRILRSTEAANVFITEHEIERALSEIQGKYDDQAAFLAALEHNGLDLQALQHALRRQCRVDTILERVASRSPTVNDIEIGIYYHSHLESFQVPERREAYHILISINDQYPENTRAKARERIDHIVERLRQKPHLFEDLAGKHSECPTALQGGRIGPVRRGQLYPELDQALFKLKAGQVSGVLESEIGFHIVSCKRIQPAETLSLQKAAPQIRKLLQERYRDTCRRNWIAGLLPQPLGGQA